MLRLARQQTGRSLTVASKEALELYDQLQAIAAATPAFEPTVDGLREHTEVYTQFATEPEGVAVETVDAGGCPGLLLSPADVGPNEILLWLHGGGYNLLEARHVARMVGHFAKAMRVQALALDFRRAPEHPFPAALDDAVGAYAWCRDQGYSWIGLGGDSAGAGHAAATMLAVRQAGLPLPDVGVLISGWFDLNLTFPSLTERDARDPMNNAAGMAMLRDHYLVGHSTDDPLASPILGDLTGLPPLYISVSEDEVLHDDSIEFAQRAKAAGVAVELEILDHVPHVHTFWAGNLPEADSTIQRVAEWAQAQR
jgi:epsilon-lactone hydrolase